MAISLADQSHDVILSADLLSGLFFNENLSKINNLIQWKPRLKIFWLIFGNLSHTFFSMFSRFIFPRIFSHALIGWRASGWVSRSYWLVKFDFLYDSSEFFTMSFQFRLEKRVGEKLQRREKKTNINLSKLIIYQKYRIRRNTSFVSYLR